MPTPRLKDRLLWLANHAGWRPDTRRSDHIARVLVLVKDDWSLTLRDYDLILRHEAGETRIIAGYKNIRQDKFCEFGIILPPSRQVFDLSTPEAGLQDLPPKTFAPVELRRVRRLIQKLHVSLGRPPRKRELETAMRQKLIISSHQAPKILKAGLDRYWQEIPVCGSKSLGLSKFYVPLMVRRWSREY